MNKKRAIAGSFLFTKSGECWQRPTLALSHPRTTIGAGGLNCQVRDGTGCTPSALATNKTPLSAMLLSRRRSLSTGYIPTELCMCLSLNA